MMEGMSDIASEVPPGEWMAAVAAVLPRFPSSSVPFTLGEAVEEYGNWARAASSMAWARKANRRSLARDLEEGLHDLGRRSRDLMGPLIASMSELTVREEIAAAATEILDVWRREDTVRATFRDLCDQAASGSSARDLGPLAAALHSQVTAASWGRLGAVAGALDGTPWGVPAVVPAAPHDLLREAERLLLTPAPTGDVVIWMIYRRVQLPWRFEIGPITVLRADWFAEHARRDDGEPFAERDELRKIIEDTHFGEEIARLTKEPANHVAIVRVPLGVRSVAGATTDAARMLDAFLSIVVGAGGLEWLPTGQSYIVLNGEPFGPSFARSVGTPAIRDDGHGMTDTARLVHGAASMFPPDGAWPMPDELVDAALAIREARMTDHREVMFHGAWATTPRIATGLEDQALELVAQFSGMDLSQLQDAMFDRIVDAALHQEIAGGVQDLLQAAVDDTGLVSLGNFIDWDNNGMPALDMNAVLTYRSQLLGAQAPRWAKRSLEDALKVIDDVEHERRLNDRLTVRTQTIRDRALRVRNAVTHGNPVTDNSLASVREYSRRVAIDALHLALYAFTTGTTVHALLAEEREARGGDRARRAAGVNLSVRSGWSVRVADRSSADLT